MSTPAEAPSERAIAAYAGDELVLALEEIAGPIFLAGDAIVLVEHARVRGRLRRLDPAVLAVLRRPLDAQELIAALVAGGLVVERPPRAALAWALDR